jgi:hypothetical protein
MIALKILDQWGRLHSSEFPVCERLDQVATGFLKSLGAAEFSGVRPNQHRSEVVLSDQEAELVRSIDWIVTGDG